MKLLINEVLDNHGIELARLAFVLDIPEETLAQMVNRSDTLSVEIYFRIRAFLKASDSQLIDFGATPENPNREK